jgi:branched-subunit amino acid ABC-type transport system permease component
VSDLLPVLVFGLATGSIYGMAATGLVLTYKASGIFNFAHGTLAAGAAYLFWELRDRRGVPWPAAAAVCIVVAGPLAGIALEAVSRRISRAVPAARIVATVGLLLVVQGIITAVYGPGTRFFHGYLPSGTLSVAGARVGVDQVIIVAVAIASCTGLSLFFARSRLGAAVRAVVEDPALVSLTGTNPVVVRRLAWMLGASFAALSGILLAPSFGLDPVLLTLLVVQAFGAAAVGRLWSLPWTFAGGVLLGVLEVLATRYLGQVRALAGLPSSLPFLVLVAVLLVTAPARLAVTDSGARRPAGPVGPRLTGVAPRWLIGLAGGAALAGVPFVVGARLPLYTNGLVLFITFLSLAVLVNLSGQVSLCQAAFAAVGATTFSHVAEGAGLPWPVAVLAAGLVAIPLGAAVAVPAVRLSGLYLALATFGFGILVERMLFHTGFMFGAFGTRLTPRPASFGLGSDQGFYFVVLICAGLSCAAVVALRRSRAGRLLRCLADAPTALETLGTNVQVSRVLIFCISAFLAGVAGALAASLHGSVTTVAYGPLTSLLWVAALAVGGGGLVGTAFVAAFALAVLPSYTGGILGDHQLLVFGAAALLAAIASTRPARAGRWDRLAESAAWRRRRSPVRSRRSAQPVGVAP